MHPYNLFISNNQSFVSVYGQKSKTCFSIAVRSLFLKQIKLIILSCLCLKSFTDFAEFAEFMFRLCRQPVDCKNDSRQTVAA